MTSTQQLLAFLGKQPHEVFKLAGRIDSHRYLPRDFPTQLPLLISLQCYPGYKSMVGENWLHWHDYYEFFLALSGRGHFRSGHDQFIFHPGDLVIVDPLKIHGVMQMEAAHTALVVLFPRQLVASSSSGLDEAYLSAWDQRASSALPLLPHWHEQAGQVHASFLSLVQTWYADNKSESALLQLKLDLLNVLLRLRDATPLARSQPMAEADRIKQEERLRLALNYVAQHIHEPFTQTDVAKVVGMSVSRFRAFFKATTGWGFAQYVREQRVERAAKLLRQSNDTVAAIAHFTGFADQSHLLRCFKEKHRISPTAYRQMHQD